MTRTAHFSTREECLARPIRVVHIIDDLGMGGAQRQLTELVKAMPRDRYAVQVISLSRTKTVYARAIRAAGVRLSNVPQSGKWSWRTFRIVVRLLQRERPDIVHTWLFTADLYGRLAAWLCRVPVVISAVRSIEPWKPSRHVLVDRLLRQVTDAFTVNARAVGDVLASRERVPRRKIHTIYNAVDLRLFDASRGDGAIRKALGIGQSTPLIGTVGRLGPEKDHASLLQAAARVMREAPQARFLVVGSGPLKTELDAAARRLRLQPYVRFLESRPDIAEVFAALDVVVISSRYEGCCNVILEAMAMGKPVVATAVGGNPELVAQGETGLLVPPGDPGRLAQAIGQLVRDPARARAMGEAGRRRVEAMFSLSRMVRETAALYESLHRGASAC